MAKERSDKSGKTTDGSTAKVPRGVRKQMRRLERQLADAARLELKRIRKLERAHHRRQEAEAALIELRAAAGAKPAAAPKPAAATKPAAAKPVSAAKPVPTKRAATAGTAPAKAADAPAPTATAAATRAKPAAARTSATPARTRTTKPAAAPRPAAPKSPPAKAVIRPSAPGKP